MLSFINDKLFISLDKNFEKSNANLVCSYNIITFLFKQFGFAIEYNKSKVFHFSRFTKNFDLSPLNLESLEGPIL